VNKFQLQIFARTSPVENKTTIHQSINKCCQANKTTINQSINKCIRIIFPGSAQSFIFCVVYKFAVLFPWQHLMHIQNENKFQQYEKNYGQIREECDNQEQQLSTAARKEWRVESRTKNLAFCSIYCYNTESLIVIGISSQWRVVML
jgi:hypothetical protein